MIGIGRYLTLGLAVLCAVLMLSTCEYRRQYKSASLALSVQNDAIKAQNEQAKQRLADLTTERDAAQALYNAAQADQKAKDETFNKALADMRTALSSAPVRVRVQRCDAGSSGGGTAGAAQPGAGSGSQAGATATGLLPEKNSRLLNSELIGVEELSRDFNTCQAELFARAKK